MWGRGRWVEALGELQALAAQNGVGGWGAPESPHTQGGGKGWEAALPLGPGGHGLTVSPQTKRQKLGDIQVKSVTLRAACS